MQGATGWVPCKPDGLSWLSWTRWTETETSVFKNQKMQWKYTLNIFVVELKLCDLSYFLQPRWNLISGSSIFWEQLYKRFLVFCVRLFYNKINFVFTRSSQHSSASFFNASCSKYWNNFVSDHFWISIEALFHKRKSFSIKCTKPKSELFWEKHEQCQRPQQRKYWCQRS